jgi:hypothetical protein
MLEIGLMNVRETRSERTSTPARTYPREEQKLAQAPGVLSESVVL